MNEEGEFVDSHLLLYVISVILELSLCSLARTGGVLQSADEERPGHGLCCGSHSHPAGVPQERQR